MARKVNEIVRILKGAGLGFKEVVDNRLFVREEVYGRPGAKEFFVAVKQGDFQAVRLGVERDRYLPLCFDNFERTPLHWAAKRDHLKIFQHLLPYSYADQPDAHGSTPALYAGQQSNKAMLSLLTRKTNPFKRNYKGLNLLELLKSDGRIAKEVYEIIRERFRELFCAE